MVTQDSVEQHAANLQKLGDSLKDRIELEVEKVVVGVLGKVLNKDRKDLNDLASIFQTELDSSDYYLVLQAFVSNFSIQVHAFGNFYRAMQDSRRLPSFSIPTKDRSSLAQHGANVLMVLERESHLAKATILDLVARSGGGVDEPLLVKGLSEGIRRLTRVVPIARDHQLLYFRMVGNSVYRSVEEQGVRLEYSYVGSRGETNREFCAKLLDSNRRYTREEILDMENGQVGDAFVGAGGHGCVHWWKVADEAPPPIPTKQKKLSGWRWQWSR